MKVRITGIYVLVILAVFFIIRDGAAPKTYKLELNERSPYNISAPRDVINYVKAQEAAEAAEAEAEPVLKSGEDSAFEAYRSIDRFFDTIYTKRNDVIAAIEAAGIIPGSTAYSDRLLKEQENAAAGLLKILKESEVYISEEQSLYLVSKAEDKDIQNFRTITMDLVSTLLREQITESNLSEKILKLQDEFQKKNLNQSIINIGIVISKAVIKPSMEIDKEMTEARKRQAYSEAYGKALENEKVLKGEMIISTGGIVTEDILIMLKELNLLEDEKHNDFVYDAGILLFLLLCAGLFSAYLKLVCRNIVFGVNQAGITAIIFVLAMLSARIMSSYFPPVAIPAFFAAMLITILINYNVAIVINLILALCASIMVRGDMQFLYMALISGTLTSIIISKTSQRSRIALAGVLCGIFNAAVVASIGLIYRDSVQTVLIYSAVALANGILCSVLTLGTLPFWESAFNVITPMKLLELVNPNHQLLKRLLVEAPGTYHHSIMVGNLAEMAIEAIGGNALLTRAGAYYHDIGKLKRPYFFKENQMDENPHDRISPETSKMVITSHTGDGVALALKHKLPAAVIDIIGEHHGTTTVSYFLYKAKINGNNSVFYNNGNGNDKNDNSGNDSDKSNVNCSGNNNADNNGNNNEEQKVNRDDYRYGGPKPKSREAAAVMLADCVEAAVRSMPDRKEAEIDVLIRKIVKERLDDGQLDKCDLTLKDLNDMADAFMRALGGYFHKRIVYPESEEGSNENNIRGESGGESK